MFNFFICSAGNSDIDQVEGLTSAISSLKEGRLKSELNWSCDKYQKLFERYSTESSGGNFHPCGLSNETWPGWCVNCAVTVKQTFGLV